MKTTVDQLYPDIWQQVFEYFNAFEIFFSFMHVTKAADEVLLSVNHHFGVRGLVIDIHVRTLPEKLLLSQVISLELYEDSYLNIIEQCIQLRSLKLIGHPQWIICLLRNISQANIKLEQLNLSIPSIGLLHDLLASIAILSSLRRLEIHADQLEERIKAGSSFLALTKIEQFILHSCSSISWNDLSYMLPGLSNVRFLDITLFPRNNKLLCSFLFPKLRCLSLTLIQVSFEWIIQLVTTTPSLVKLTLNGLVDDQGFVINHKWFDIFEYCSSLEKIIVSVSLEQAISSYYSEITQASLHKINLNLKLFNEDCEYYSDRINQNRWWNLSGVITKHYGDAADTY